MEWKKVKLGEVAILKNGKKRPTTQGNVPAYGGNGVIDYVSDANNENCCIIGRVGAYCGCVYFSQDKCWVSDNAISASAKENSDSKFLFYLLSNIDLHHHHIGGAQPLMTQDIISRLEIPLPPLPTQRRIAAILSSLDAQIENNNRINRNLEAQAQALFKSWFVDFEPWNGQMPDDWKEGTLGEIIEERAKSKIQVSEAKNSNGVFPFFTSGTSILKYQDYLIDGRNIFLNTGGNADVKYYIGKAAYSTDTWCIAGKENFTDWLYLYLHGMVDILNAQYFEGSALKHLKKKNLQERELIIPSNKEVEAFNVVVSPMFDVISQNFRSNARLAALRDTLLPKLMKGEIEL